MKMLLNGNWIETPMFIRVFNPQDNSLIDTTPRANVDMMREAIEAAVRALPCAKNMPVHKRIAILQKTAQIVTNHHEDFAQTIAREGVKTIREARKEVTRCIETLRISAEEARRLIGETIPFDQMAGSEGRMGYYTRMPIGVIGAITPFNDPLNLVAHKIGPAIATGNCIIVKPHEETPLSALMLAKAVDEAGLPAGILQVITGYGSEIGDALVTDPRVRMISFTGGRATGESVIRKAGLKKVSMELGSNSPVIVMPDADLQKAVSACVSGAYWAAGQNCLHVQRLLIHGDIYDAFTNAFIQATEQYHVGDKLDEKTDMGPLINEVAARRIESLVQEAIQAGARLRTGGIRQGNFYAPTVLEDVPEICAIAHEEIFGPVTLFYRFQTLDEAIQKANELDYGLQAGIFTQNLQTAFSAFSRLECGGVMVNDSTDYRIDAMPFGGIKGSGLGREGVRFAIQEMTEPKMVCFSL